MGFQVVYYSANLANLELRFPSSPLPFDSELALVRQKCKQASEAIEVRGIQGQMWTPSPLLTPLVSSDPRSTIRLWDNTLTSMGISASGRGICLSIFPHKLLSCPPSLGWELVNDFSQIYQILPTLTSPIPSTTV